MMCFIFSVAVVCLVLAGLCLMVGWRSGAAQLARLAIALVIGSAIVSWFVDALRAFFSRPGIATVAGSITVLLLVAALVFGIGWFLKQRSAASASTRPTLRRRAPLAELAAEHPRELSPHQSSSATDDIQLFGGGR
mgnify:CR=1 FL=1